MISQIISRFKTNWKSGVTVSLVSIPLSISLAVASGSTPLAGIITGIWAGLIASFFGGSDFNIVGPTGALSGILATYAIIHGASTLSMLAIVAGLSILIAYAFRLERFLVFIPSSVIHGFTLGVAFIIGLNETNFALGLKGLPKHEQFIQNILESLRHLTAATPEAIILFLIFLAGLFLMRKLTPRLPGAVTLSPLGIIIGYLATTGRLPWHFDTLGSNFGAIAAKLFVFPSFNFESQMIVAGLTVALVAILETMLSAKIADSMTKTKHNERKEMLGLGLANIASGLAGGIPATAALARTSLNVKTGANNKMSATVNSICIILISLALFKYFTFIPMAVIAAILVYVAIQMVEAEHFITLYRHNKLDFALAMVVAFVTVYLDPIIGILLGTALALIIFMEKLSHGDFDLTIPKYAEDIVDKNSGKKLKEIKENKNVLLYSFYGKLVFINSRSHVERFNTDLSQYQTIILRLREVHLIDLDGAAALDEIINIIKNKKQQVLVCSVTSKVAETLEHHSPAFRDLKAAGLVFPKATNALAFLGIRSSDADRESFNAAAAKQ